MERVFHDIVATAAPDVKSAVLPASYQPLRKLEPTPGIYRERKQSGGGVRMRTLMLVTAGAVMLATTGLAVAHGLDNGKSVKAVAGTFTAATVGNTETRSCTTVDGKAITSTNATYTGTASGDPDLSGPATLQIRSTINSTDGVGVLSGRLKIAASGGETAARIDAVYDHGAIAGVASGRVAARHVALFGNLSGSFSATGGFTNGKIGGGTAGGSAVEIGPARCAPAKPTKPVREKSEAHGLVSAVSPTSMTVGGLTCTIPSDLTSRLSTVKVNDRAEIKCSLVSGVNTLIRFEARR
jgi:hypothetical protein